LIRAVSRSQYTAVEALCIARALLRGEIWMPPYYAVATHIKGVGSPPWEVEFIEPPNPWREHMERRQAEYAHGEELARLGAEGDTVAAERFCKLFLAGVMRNEAMG
jgi:hypothetical protein